MLCNLFAKLSFHHKNYSQELCWQMTIMTTMTMTDNSRFQSLFQLDNLVSKYVRILNVYSVLWTLCFRTTVRTILSCKSKYDTCTKPPLEGEVRRLLSYFFGESVIFLLPSYQYNWVVVFICDAITFRKWCHVTHVGVTPIRMGTLHSFVSVIWPQLLALVDSSSFPFILFQSLSF